MFTIVFWRAVLERAVKTFAQSLGAVVAATSVISTLDWKTSLYAAGGATALSVLTSLGSYVLNPATGASLGAEILNGPAQPVAVTPTFVLAAADRINRDDRVDYEYQVVPSSAIVTGPSESPYVGAVVQDFDATAPSVSQPRSRRTGKAQS